MDAMGPSAPVTFERVLEAAPDRTDAPPADVASALPSELPSGSELPSDSELPSGSELPSDLTEGKADYEAFLAGVEEVLRRVDEALSRLDRGVYGSCAECGQPITDADLDATPMVGHCERHLPLGAVS
jgi:DnaK suppressor protein